MLRWIVESSLRFRVLVLGVAAAVMSLGFLQLRDAPVDALPEFLPPQVEIQTEALGLSAAEVEQLITVPLEADLLSQVAFLDQIRSESVPGLSSIQLIFEPGTELMQARQLVQERLGEALIALPNAMSQPPAMLQPLSSTSRAMMVRLSSKDLSLIEMSVLARWKIRPRLMGVPGVANVSTFGQRERELQVQVDPERLQANGVSLNQVIETTGNALWASPLSFVEASTPGTGGFIDTPNQRLAVQHILPITNAEHLAQVTIQEAAGTEERILRLGDVASVVEDHQPLIGDAVAGEDPSLIMVIEKFPGESTLTVSQAVEEALDALRPGLSGIDIDATVYRPASSIEQSMGSLGLAALIGFGLLVLLFGLYFFDWRAALIGLVAVLVSVVAAGLVLYFSGATFNAMVLAGLVVALGLVITDAVSDLDRLRTRLRENRSAGDEKQPTAVIVQTAREVRGPAFYATLVVLLVAAPLYLLSGLTGAFTRPLVASYALAVLVSMLVALTVTPALALLLLSKAPLRRRESPVAGWLGDRCGSALSRTLHKPRWAYVATGVIVLAGVVMLPVIGVQSLLPSVQERDLLIQWAATPGTSRPEMVRISEQVSRDLRRIPGVRDVGAHVGRAISSDQVVGINSGELWVSIDPNAGYGKTIDDVQDVIHGYPGLDAELQSYPNERIRQVRTGAEDPIAVRLYGQDPTVLRSEANKVRQALLEIDGVVDPTIEQAVEEPTVEVKVDLAKAEKYGLKPGDVRRAAATVMSGIRVGNLFEEQKVFDVVVWGTVGQRSSLGNIADLKVDTPAGDQVRLGDVAEVAVKPNATVIKRDAVSRYLDITADLQGRGLGSVSTDIESRLKELEFPVEYHAELLGTATEERAAQWQTLAYVLAAAVVIFLLLQAAFGSWRLAMLGFVLIPVAAIGGLLAVLANGRAISLGVLVGLIGVLGIAARNTVGLISTFQRLERHRDQLGRSELVVRGTREQLAPIVLTALATALVIIPLLLLGGDLSRDVVWPLGTVILGGLVTSTLVALFVVPAAYLLLGPGARPVENQTAATPTSSQPSPGGQTVSLKEEEKLDAAP